MLAQCCLTISVTWHVTVFFFFLEANSIAVSTERGWFWQLCDPDTSLSLNVFSALLSWLISSWECEALCEHPAAVESGSWSPGCLLRAKR